MKIYIVEGLYRSAKSQSFKYWGAVAFPEIGYGIFKSRQEAEAAVARYPLNELSIHFLDKLDRVRIIKQNL